MMKKVRIRPGTRLLRHTKQRSSGVRMPCVLRQQKRLSKVRARTKSLQHENRDRSAIFNGLCTSPNNT